MISKQSFVEILEAIEEHEKLMDSLLETEVFSLENPLFNLTTVTLNAISNDFENEAKKNIEDIDIGELIFNFVYQFNFGTKYVDYKGDPKPLITIGKISYSPKSASELYDMIIELTQEEK